MGQGGQVTTAGAQDTAYTGAKPAVIMRGLARQEELLEVELTCVTHC